MYWKDFQYRMKKKASPILVNIIPSFPVLTQEKLSKSNFAPKEKFILKYLQKRMWQGLLFNCRNVQHLLYLGWNKMDFLPGKEPENRKGPTCFHAAISFPHRHYTFATITSVHFALYLFRIQCVRLVYRQTIANLLSYKGYFEWSK